MWYDCKFTYVLSCGGNKHISISTDLPSLQLSIRLQKHVGSMSKTEKMGSVTLRDRYQRSQNT